MPLSQKILIVEFDYTGDPEDLERDALRFARPLANVSGLLWKIWLHNPAAGTFGCVYLFEDEAVMTAFVDGPISAQIDNQPQFQHIRMRSYDIMERPSLLNRAPLQPMSSSPAG